MLLLDFQLKKKLLSDLGANYTTYNPTNYYPKKMYFLQLAGTYQQMDREEDYMITLKAAHGKDLLDKEGEYLALAQLLLIKKNPYWAAQVLVSGQQKKVTIKDEDTGEEEVIPVLKDTEKNLKLLLIQSLI